jgi:hypothetical protein
VVVVAVAVFIFALCTCTARTLFVFTVPEMIQSGGGDKLYSDPVPACRCPHAPIALKSWWRHVRSPIHTSRSKPLAAGGEGGRECFELSAMGEVKHLCLVKFKEGVAVEDILKGMADLAAQMDMVKSFEW